MDPRFFLPCFRSPRTTRLGHKRKEKNSVHNLPYGPRTRLIRGMYCIALHCTALHYIALHCTVLYCVVLYCIALHYITLYCTVWYGIERFHVTSRPPCWCPLNNRILITYCLVQQHGRPILCMLCLLGLSEDALWYGIVVFCIVLQDKP